MSRRADLARLIARTIAAEDYGLNTDLLYEVSADVLKARLARIADQILRQLEAAGVRMDERA